MIDLDAADPHFLGRMPDLRGLYPAGEPGTAHLRGAVVYLTAFGIRHIRQEHPERIEWLRSSAELLRLVIESPEIAGLGLEYKARMGHWAVTLASPIPGRRGAYVSVVVSLANLDGPESDFHQLITAHRSKGRDFYDGEGTLKGRWIGVKKRGASL